MVLQLYQRFVRPTFRQEETRAGDTGPPAVDEAARQRDRDRRRKVCILQEDLRPLPPSSSVTRLKVSPAAVRIGRLVTVEPVKLTFAMSGWALSAAPHDVAMAIDDVDHAL
jgi:hypothetical protein